VPEREQLTGTEPAHRRVRENVALRGVADVGARLAGFVLLIVLARKLGASEYGIFTYALALVTVVSAFVNSGQRAVLTRDVAREPRLVHTYFANTAALQIAIALPALAVALGLALASGGATTAEVVVLLGAATVAEALSGTCTAVYAALDRFALVPLALIPPRVLITATGIAAVYAGASVETVALIYLGGSVAGFALAAALMMRRVIRPRLSITPGSWPMLLRSAAPVMITGAFAAVLLRVDTAMLAVVEPARVVGEYGAACRFLDVVIFMAWSLSAALLPTFARSTDGGAVRPVFVRAAQTALALGLVAGLVVALLARPLVEVLFGADYSGAVTATRLLSPALALYPLAQMSSILLVARHRQRLVAVAVGLVAVENIVANLFLIPRWSLEGAAFGTSLSQLLLTLPLAFYALREVA